jgi:hypothetical protein
MNKYTLFYSEHLTPALTREWGFFIMVTVCPNYPSELTPKFILPYNYPDNF